MISGISSEYTPISLGGLSTSTSSDGQRRQQGGSGGRFDVARRNNTDATGLNLSDEQKKAVAQLQARDREVRAHEQAHKAVGGAHTGGMSLSTTQGPDNRQYAVGGSVSIDTSPVEGDPEATIAKAQQVRSAALAPADPSSQDHSVAAAATRMESKARMQKLAESAYSQGQESTSLAPWGTGISLYV